MNMYLHFLSFPNNEMSQYSKPFFMDGTNPISTPRWPGDIGSQGISMNWIDLILFKYSGSTTRSIYSSDAGDGIYRQVSNIRRTLVGN